MFGGLFNPLFWVLLHPMLTAPGRLAAEAHDIGIRGVAYIDDANVGFCSEATITRLFKHLADFWRPLHWRRGR
jgi:hypothetical protein